jgi:hypothetical protein
MQPRWRPTTDPAGIMEYGLDAAEARRSFEAALREDPSREAGVWRDPATGEHVVVQGGHSYVEAGWMSHPDNLRNGRQPLWIIVVHHHPNRGLLFDRLPSVQDFAALTEHQFSGAMPRAPLRSSIVWTDTTPKIRFETEFGYTPGATRPFWTRYRVEDGTYKVASFTEPPWGAGRAEYEAFLYSPQLINPANPVPGGNLMPVPPPLPPPPGAAGRRLQPPPLPTRR